MLTIARVVLYSLALLVGAPTLARAEQNPFNTTTYDSVGWAIGIRGGAGGRIIKVTTLAASGLGSLREAIEAKGPRIVAFEVAGVIDMGGKDLTVRHPGITIAGQTAPSPGITLIKGELNISTQDVIIQHLRFRPGEYGRAKRSGYDQDGISTQTGAHHVIVDHCSLSWATDENLSVGGARFEGDTPDDWRRRAGHAITFSYNLIYEGLANSVHAKGEHSKGSLIHDNATGVLLYGNVYASNRERNALFKGGAHAAQINNLIYNPGEKAIHYNLVAHEWAGHDFQIGRLTLIGNTYRHGPDTRRTTPLFALGGHGDVRLYLRDNIAVDEVGQPVAMTGFYSAGSAKILDDPEPYLPPDLAVRSAADIERWLPLAAGARPWDRDEIDMKQLSDIAEGRGKIVDSESQNAIGYPRHALNHRSFEASDWNLDDMSPKTGWKSLFSNPTTNKQLNY